MSLSRCSKNVEGISDSRPYFNGFIPRRVKSSVTFSSKSFRSLPDDLANRSSLCLTLVSRAKTFRRAVGSIASFGAQMEASDRARRKKGQAAYC